MGGNIRLTEAQRVERWDAAVASGKTPKTKRPKGRRGGTHQQLREIQQEDNDNFLLEEETKRARVEVGVSENGNPNSSSSSSSASSSSSSSSSAPSAPPFAFTYGDPPNCKCTSSRPLPPPDPKLLAELEALRKQLGDLQEKHKPLEVTILNWRLVPFPQAIHGSGKDSYVPKYITTFYDGREYRSFPAECPWYGKFSHIMFPGNV